MTNTGITTDKKRISIDLIKKEETFAKSIFTGAGKQFQDRYVFSKIYEEIKDSVEYIKFIE